MEDYGYFRWLLGFVTNWCEAQDILPLLRCMYNKEFYYTIQADGNRAEDGIELRADYEYSTGNTISDNRKNKGCSILEMMVALAIRASETVTVDPEYPKDIFRVMLINLGVLNVSTDRDVNDILDTFLQRGYEKNGAGGLFITESDLDMRTVDIWYQAMYYLASQD